MVRNGDTNDSSKQTENYSKSVNIEYCDWIGPKLDLNRHIQQCPYHVIKCVYCKDLLLRKDKNNHNIICFRYPEQCKQCHIQIPRCFVLRHMIQECPYSLISGDTDLNTVFVDNYDKKKTLKEIESRMNSIHM